MTGRSDDKLLSAIEGDWTQRLRGFAQTVFVKSEHMVNCRDKKGELLLQWARSKRTPLKNTDITVQY